MTQECEILKDLKFKFNTHLLVYSCCGVVILFDVISFMVVTGGDEEGSSNHTIHQAAVHRRCWTSKDVSTCLILYSDYVKTT